MVRLDLAALALAAIVRGAPVPETSPTLAERQFTIGNPWTGVWPPGLPDTPISECESGTRRERRAEY